MKNLIVYLFAMSLIAFGLELTVSGQPSTQGVNASTLQDAEVTPSEVLSELKQLKDEVAKHKQDKENKKNDTSKALATAGILASVFKLLLSLLKKLPFEKMSSWFQTTQGRMTVRYSTLGLGVAAAFCANLGFGFDVMDSLIIAFSGPGSVAVHEYSDMTPLKQASS